MPPLPSDLRKQLEKAIVKARQEAEAGAKAALEALAVHLKEKHSSMTDAENKLRNRLRAHGRQLGDALDKQRGTQTIARLVREVAYEHWHRMLFARFLAENDLLIEPEHNLPLRLEEVMDYARELDQNPWEMASRFAQRMLPQIFRPDDPALQVALPLERRKALEKLLAALPREVFTADDSLGWTYQFWQSAEKDAVNARVRSGEKITGETLPAVTQLFTEHYMVLFLLHNTIGAWHAGKTLKPSDRERAESEQELRDAVALDGYTFDYLRFVRDPKEGEDLNAGTGPWRPAAGTYDGWPKTAAELRVLDPCCGSGHFLVAAFELLVRLRTFEEGLGVEEAAAAVIRENLFGLELDQRCTQIAAFNLALAAWRLAGRHFELPSMRIACSGIGPQASREEWLRLAEGAKAAWESVPKHAHGSIRNGLLDLHETFSKAPELGSLIDPADRQSDLITADYETLRPFLEKVFEAEGADDEGRERAVAARGMADAAEMLSATYTLVVTNFPFLGLEKQGPVLSSLLKARYEPGRRELATAFLLRCKPMTGAGGTCAAIMPGEWTYSRPNRHFREHILDISSFCFTCFCGKESFSSGLRASPVLAAVSWQRGELPVCTVDARPMRFSEKATTLNAGPLVQVMPSMWREAPSHRFVLSEEFSTAQSRLGDFADAKLGVSAGDGLRFEREFWELREVDDDWEYLQGPVSSLIEYGGRSAVVWWEQERGQIVEVAQSVKHLNHAAQNWQRGRPFWGRSGVLMSQMGALTIYSGEIFDCRCLVIMPKNEKNAAALAAFALSGQLQEELKAFDDGFKIGSPKALMDIPFDLAEWEPVAQDLWKGGLPAPQSDDPTQWLFHGRPERAEAHAPLQVGVARLVGYRWPAELDEQMRLAPEARELVRRCAELAPHADEDGIVCIPSIKGERTAAERLRALLRDAFGDRWTASTERELLAAAAHPPGGKPGRPAADLDAWLRDDFFDQHCALFHHRPFVWHVWDGRKDGFHALVNYHKLAGPDGLGKRTLEMLTYTYLNDWIERQRAAQKEGEPGADGRLAAALALQDRLKKIIAGEPPHDIFVRWKPLHEQPIGWEPDINDGVRLNIRPFLAADLPKGRKGAGVLRGKPNIKWTKDRGKEPQKLRPREDFPWFWSWDEKTQDFTGGKAFDGVRHNDLHYTVKAKREAREQANATAPGRA